MQETIHEKPDQIERDYGFSISFADESAGRARGSPSADNDFNVRLVYAHPLDWYLSMAKSSLAKTHGETVCMKSYLYCLS